MPPVDLEGVAHPGMHYWNGNGASGSRRAMDSYDTYPLLLPMSAHGQAANRVHQIDEMYR